MCTIFKLLKPTLIAVLLLTISGLYSKTTLKVFHYLDKADQVATENFNQVLEAFNKANPDIDLQFDYLTGESYHNKLQALNIANQLPDLIFLWPGKRTGKVTGSGKIKDLRPFLRGETKNFAPSAMAPQGRNGEIYELPEQVTATHVMYVNEKLLKQLGLTFPKTLRELLAQGKKIRDAGLIPIAMDNKDGWQMQSCLLGALVERTGGRKWMEDAMTGKASFRDREFVAALEVIKTLQDEKMFSPGINQAEYGRALTDFVTGKAVYLIDGGWRTPGIISEMNEADHKNISLQVFPSLPNEKGQRNSTSTVAGTGFGMNAKLSGSKARAAWKWIWFFSGPEGSKIKQKQGWVPAYKLPSLKGANPLIQKQTKFIGNTPGGYVIDAVMDAEGMGLLQSQIQEMMFGALTPQQVGSNYERWVAANDSARK